MNNIEQQAIDELYKILESPRNSTYKELKKQHRRLAAIYHPDRNNNSEESIIKMSQINEAFHTLTNPTILRNYLDNYKKTHQQVTNNNQSSLDVIDTWQDAEYTQIIEEARDIDNLEDFLYYLKEDYKEAYHQVRKEEKSFTLKERLSLAKSYLEQSNLYNKINSNILRKGYKVSGLIITELMFQLGKLKKQIDDTIPKYTVRNRKTLAGLMIAGLLFNPLGVNAETEELTHQDIPTQTESTKPTDMNLLIDGYRLDRIYTVTEEDTLESLAKQANTTVEKIIKLNKLRNNALIVGETIKIPYYVDKEDIKYYTESVNSTNYEKLEDLAEEYQTDIRTIYSLNAECFEVIDDKLVQISDNLLVPLFPTKEEVKELKQQSVYQKTPKN